jgi:hypothetical protein
MSIEPLTKEESAVAMQNRIQNDIQRGMIKLLNTGFPEKKRLFVAAHNMAVEMPAPGAVFEVPTAVADHLLRTFRSKLQRVTGSVPQNFTPPPGFKLVPAEEDQVEDGEVVDAMDLVQQEQDSKE